MRYFRHRKIKQNRQLLLLIINPQIETQKTSHHTITSTVLKIKKITPPLSRKPHHSTVIQPKTQQEMVDPPMSIPIRKGIIRDRTGRSRSRVKFSRGFSHLITRGRLALRSRQSSEILQKVICLDHLPGRHTQNILSITTPPFMTTSSLKIPPPQLKSQHKKSNN